EQFRESPRARFFRPFATNGPKDLTSGSCALPETVQGARPPRSLLHVDPRLLDNERLPKARRDALDLVVGVWLRLADGHRIRETLGVLLEVEREGHAARHVLRDHGDAVAAQQHRAMLSQV